MGVSHFDAVGVNRRREIKYKKVVVTSAQLLALFTTPVTLVPAPTGDRALVLDRILIVKPAGTAYAGIASGEDLVVKYTDASGAEVSVDIETEGFLDQTTIQRRQGMPDAANQVLTKNAALVLHLLTGNITTGNSPLICHVWYSEVVELDSQNVGF